MVIPKAEEGEYLLKSRGLISCQQFQISNKDTVTNFIDLGREIMESQFVDILDGHIELVSLKPGDVLARLSMVLEDHERNGTYIEDAANVTKPGAAGVQNVEAGIWLNA